MTDSEVARIPVRPVRALGLSSRDALAAVFVGGAVAVFVLWASGAAFDSLSTRVIGAIVFGLGFAACMTVGPAMLAVYGPSDRRAAPAPSSC